MPRQEIMIVSATRVARPATGIEPVTNHPLGRPGVPQMPVVADRDMAAAEVLGAIEMITNGAEPAAILGQIGRATGATRSALSDNPHAVEVMAGIDNMLGLGGR